jgi:hypothetical protein
MSYFIIAELIIAVFLIIAPIGMLSALIVNGILEGIEKWTKKR